jgi:enoyl-[acyl-carrier protein] reductase III
MRFQGKVGLITGSSRGIGRALALHLAREGATVVVHYKQNAEAAAKTVAECEAAGGHAWAMAADLEDVAAIEALFDTVAERHGRLDFFVSNAAATAFKPAMATKPHHLERTFNMNVRAFIVGVQRAAALMAPGGRVLAISSYGSMRAFPTYANLGASKAALEAWVRFFAEELGPRGITVNALNAGVVETDSAEFFYGQAGMAPVAKRAWWTRCCSRLRWNFQ